MESNTKSITAELKTLRGNSSWFEHWFDSSFYHQLYGHRDEKEASCFIDNLLNELEPTPGSSILDLGCGAGRHAKRLASKGFNVTGLDLAASSIRQAKKFENDNLRFARQDMRQSFGRNRYDYVFNFFTSFGYFAAEENNRVIANMAAALKPGATLVIDYINAAYSEQRLVPEEKKEIDAVIYRISRWTDDQNFYKKISIENGGINQPADYVEQVAKYGVRDFNRMFQQNGLELQKLFGNYELDCFDSQTSPRLILLAKKIS